MNQTIRSYNWTPKERIDHLMYLRSFQFITKLIRKHNPLIAALPKETTDLFDYRIPNRGNNFTSLIVFLKPGIYGNLEVTREVRFVFRLDNDINFPFSELLDFLGLINEPDIKRSDAVYYDDTYLSTHTGLINQCYRKTYNDANKSLDMEHNGTLYRYAQSIRLLVMFTQDSYSIRWT